MRLSNFVLAALLVLAHCVITQGPVTPTTTDLNCDLNRNPALGKFMAWAGLSQSQIQLREETDLCKGEWSVYKTCCPNKEFQQYVSASIGSNPQANWHAYMAKVKDFKSKVAGKLKNTITKISQNKDKWVQKSSKGQNKGGCPMENYSSTTIDKLKYFADNYDKFQDEYKTDASKCFDGLKTFKANTACSICSGRGWQMLSNEDGSINTGSKVFRIKSEACRTILGSCGKVFRFTYYLQQAIQLVQSLRLNYGQSKKTRGCLDNFDSYRHDQINTAFAQCFDGSLNTCTDPNAFVLCKSFLKLGDLSSVSEGDPTLVADEINEDTDAAGNLINTRLMQSAEAGTYAGNYEVVTDSQVNAVGSDSLMNGQSGAVPSSTVSVAYLTDSSFSNFVSFSICLLLLAALFSW